MMNEKAFKNFDFTIIGANCRYTGNIEATGDLLVNGEIKGDITLNDRSKITIERDAMVSGNIYCHDIEVFGRVSGSINSTGTLIVRSNALVSGKVKANGLSIYPGAVLNIDGSCERENEKHGQETTDEQSLNS